tara:strand:- start:123 stop:443 length:321 start_codon:yes stop_codon:yes gene_type:complete
MKKLENEVIKVLRSFATTVKVGSSGDYEQYQAITDDEFVDLTIELVEKLTIPVVSSSADFRENANPLLKYLAENHHPHTTAIITSTSIELVEGIKAEHKIYDYIKD